jgi:hypothetical protein
MKILAFLQSPSDATFPDTEKHLLDKYRDDQAYHRKMLRQSMTGNRLYQSFGPLFDEIHWDNVAPIKEVDHEHINDMIVKMEPDLILTFGNDARDALADSIGAIRIKVMECHHPNARYRTQSELDDFAAKVREYVLMKEREIESTED